MRLKKGKIQKMVSYMLTIVILISSCPFGELFAEVDTKEEMFLYTIFATSHNQNAIRLNTNNFCINGNIGTNGTVFCNGNMNINGMIKEGVNEDCNFITDKITNYYFKDTKIVYSADTYFGNDRNICVNETLEFPQDMVLTGNISINSALKTKGNICFNGDTLNGNMAVIYSESGDIVINNTNIGITGFLYAPNGMVKISAQNLNLNNIIIIADTIVLTSDNINVNYNYTMGKFLGINYDKEDENKDTQEEESREIQSGETESGETESGETESGETESGETESGETESGETESKETETESEQQGNIEEESESTEPESDKKQEEPESYTENRPEGEIEEETTKKEETIEKEPVEEETEWDYEEFAVDSDDDGIEDGYEKIFGTDSYNPDTDKDGLSDGEEVYFTDTDPLLYSSVTEGVSDENADCDQDGLSNRQEIIYGTLPEEWDTDQDGLSDYEELFVYNTNPLEKDTDGDKLNDGDEIIFAQNPNDKDSNKNGIIDGEECFELTTDKIRFEETLFEDNNAQILNLDLSVKGSSTDIEVLEYDDYLKGDSAGYVGKVVEITGGEILTGDITFKIQENYFVELYEVGSELTNGLLICYYDGEETVPLETLYDESTRELHAEISQTGIYFVMDVIAWLDSAGISLENYATEKTQEVQFRMNTISKVSRFMHPGTCGLIWNPDSPFTIALAGPIPKIVTLKKAPNARVPVDTDGDGLLDIEELKSINAISHIHVQPYLYRLGLSINYDIDRVLLVYEYYTNPARKDTDGDGLDDWYDSKPCDETVQEFLIYETANDDEELNYLKKYENMEKWPEDLRYADMSEDEILRLHHFSEKDFQRGNLSMLKWEKKMKRLLKTASMGDLQDVALDMFEHFCDGTGTNYYNDVLTKEIEKHEQSKSYVETVGKFLDELLKENEGDISALKYQKEGREKTLMCRKLRDNEIDEPYFRDPLEGLAICVDSLYGNSIGITEYELEGNHYRCTVHFTYYDIFGLNTGDVEPKEGESVNIFGMISSFRAWYILQHYDALVGIYKPFISYMEFDRVFEGDI